MIGLLANLVGGALDPLLDRASGVAARLLRKLALFVVAAVCLGVVIFALTIAFALWVASKFGSIAGALAVAMVYLMVAIAAVVLALQGPKRAAPGEMPSAAEADAVRARRSAVDMFAAPLMNILAGLGLRREQLAVLAGSSLAKQLGPLPMVGLAVVGGFLVGRMWKTWRRLLSADALTGLLASVGLFDDEAREANDEDVPA